jgi:mono/diheme cytochrome c family protein
MLDGSGKGTIGRNLKLRDIRPAIQSMTDAQLRQIILEGKGKMRPNKKLDDEKVRKLTDFLRDLAAGNPETGQAVSETQSRPLPRADTAFRDKCSACHGTDGTGRTTIGKRLQIPDLASQAVQIRSSEELAMVISQGKGKMPAYAKKFNPVQIGQLVSYIQTFTKTDSEKGLLTSEESPSRAPEPVPPRSLQIAPQPATNSPAPIPGAHAAQANSSRERKKKSPEPNAVTTRANKKAPLSGRQLYMAKCFACHSSDGSGMGTLGKSLKIPSLISPDVQAKTDEALADIIRNGAGKMPSYKKKLNRDQTQMLVTYIRELSQKH